MQVWITFKTLHIRRGASQTVNSVTCYNSFEQVGKCSSSTERGKDEGRTGRHCISAEGILDPKKTTAKMGASPTVVMYSPITMYVAYPKHFY